MGFSAGISLASLAISAFSATKTEKAQTDAEETAANQANIAKAQAQTVTGPNAPNTAANIQASEQSAASQGGTVTQNAGAVGDAANQPRKQQLGS